MNVLKQDSFNDWWYTNTRINMISTILRGTRTSIINLNSILFSAEV